MFWSAIYITLLQSSQNYLNFHILLKRFQSKLEFWIPKHTAKLSVVVITQQDMKYNASCRNFSIETRIEHIFQLFPLLLYTIQHKFVDFKTYTISTIKRSHFFFFCWYGWHHKNQPKKNISMNWFCKKICKWTWIL